MKMKMKSVSVFLLILVLLEVTCCQGCRKHEREALLGLNARYGYPFIAWVDGTDCCQWEGVECNTTTGRVMELDLYDLFEMGDTGRLGHRYQNYSDFLVFEDLKSLDLSWNNIAGCVENEGLRLSNLEVLDLSGNSLDNDASILSCLDGLSSLKSLYLSSNGLNATSFRAFETLSSKLLNLEVLHLSGNYYLTNDILPSLGGFKSLKNLSLSDTGLDSELHIQGLSSMLINLEVLDISRNNFNESDITSALSGLSSLKSLTLRASQLTPRSIHSISKLSSLEILDLAGNQLNDSILRSLGFAWPTSLEALGLSNNHFSNNLLSSLSGLGRLKSLDLSNNQLEGSLNISGLLVSSNLGILDLSYNDISNFVVHQGSKALSKLDVLSLDGNKINGSMLRKSLRVFSSIRVLYLRYNEFQGKIVAEDFRDLGNLENLDLYNSSNIVNEFFKSIGSLASLKVLSLSECGFNGTLPADWSELKKLEELDLSGNEFEGPLPSSFGNMTSLWKLRLSGNDFTGNFGSNLASLPSLEYLDFAGNQFEVPISFAPFANLSNLKVIYGEGNKVILDSHPTLQTWVPKFQLQELSLSTEANSLSLPNFLLYQYNLTSLDFTGFNLEGEFPTWLLENNTKMTGLVIRNCSFTGTFQLPSRPLLSMSAIDVSANYITGQIPSTNVSSIFPNLEYLNMSINKIHGSIPHEFGQMNFLETLDLSENDLSGEIPKNISGVRSLLKLLKLSNNNLDGLLFPTLSTLNNLEVLYLDGNSFSGSIPSSFYNTSLSELDISNNHFVGKLPSGIGNLSQLEVLNMSNNHLEGSIPSKIVESQSLVYLDISGNNLTGSVPSFVNSSSSLRFIHLSNNKLSGLAKRMFSKRSSLVTLDLRYNELTTSIHDMIQDLKYTGLYILLLKGNHFTGQIPKQLCQLITLKILDLSYNKFSGPIPSCLGKIPFENKDTTLLDMLFLDHIMVIYRGEISNLTYMPEKADFTTKKRSYNYVGRLLAYMTGIDLSHNKLNGSIPSELGNLTKIRALNLSHNYLTGQIPTTFSNLVQIESLDLSFNKLSGNIPPQLSDLNSLAVFSVAHNNLSGETPDRKGQFMTFDKSSYEGNPFLCGLPLPKSCTASGPNASYADGDNNDSLVDMYVFCVSFAVSYISVLVVIAAVLYINPYWRRAWFYYIELVGTNCYYFIEDNLRKFSNIGNM